MNILRINVNVLLVISMVVLTQSRPHNEDAFYPEPSVQNPKTPIKITLLPFYGGAKGQTLQITETVDGSVMTEVLQGMFAPIEAMKKQEEHEEEQLSHVVENPTLPVRQESEYGLNIKNIHHSALSIIRLQETAKNKGLNEQEEAAYKEHMESLNQSAHNLAKIYEEDDEDVMVHNRAGLSGWFARKKNTKKDNKSDKDKKKEEEDKKKKQAQEEADKKKKDEDDKKKKDEEEKKRKDEDAKKKKDADEKKKKEEEEKKRKEEEEKKKQEQQEAEEEEDEIVPTRHEETSVAEAKPVGLAVAGIGGVASSKPIATAVVGPGGLAIARPVGTAIAGVSPDQALVPIYAEGFVVPNKPTSTKGDKKHTHSTEYLNKIISKYHQV